MNYNFRILGSFQNFAHLGFSEPNRKSLNYDKLPKIINHLYPTSSSSPVANAASNTKSSRKLRRAVHWEDVTQLIKVSSNGVLNLITIFLRKSDFPAEGERWTEKKFAAEISSTQRFISSSQNVWKNLLWVCRRAAELFRCTLVVQKRYACCG